MKCISRYNYSASSERAIQDALNAEEAQKTTEKLQSLFKPLSKSYPGLTSIVLPNWTPSPAVTKSLLTAKNASEGYSNNPDVQACMQSLSSKQLDHLKHLLNGKLTKALDQFYRTAAGGMWTDHERDIVRERLQKQQPKTLSKLLNTVLAEEFDVNRPAKSCRKAAKFVGETAVGLALYPVAAAKIAVNGLNRVVNPEGYAHERGGVTSPAFTMLTGAGQVLASPVLGLAYAVAPTADAINQASANQWRNDVHYDN